MVDATRTPAHSRFRLSKAQKVGSVIFIASAFFIVEIVIGIKTRSLALIADAFHIFSDLLGYIAAWIAIRLATSAKNASFTYGYQRGEILGGFFNGGGFETLRSTSFYLRIHVPLPLSFALNQPFSVHWESLSCCSPSSVLLSPRRSTVLS